MKLLRTLTATLALALLCFGCGKPVDSSEAGAAVPEKARIALVMKSLANEFFVKMADGARRHQSAHSDRYELIVNGIKNETDLAQQVALVDQMVAMGVDAIVIAPADSKALVPALAKARRAGIVVVNIDNRLEAEVLEQFGLKIPFIGPDNRKGARMVADHVLADHPRGTQVAILEGVPTAVNSIMRREGFEESIAEKGMKLVSMQSAHWEATKAADLTSAIITQHPDLKVILAANDNMALGAAAAIKLANLDHRIDIAGFDNISAIHSLIREDRVAATAEQYGDKFAVYGIEFALQALENGGEASIERETPVDLVTRETLRKILHETSGG